MLLYWLAVSRSTEDILLRREACPARQATLAAASARRRAQPTTARRTVGVIARPPPTGSRWEPTGTGLPVTYPWMYDSVVS
jgi:hypothetical protein